MLKDLNPIEIVKVEIEEESSFVFRNNLTSIAYDISQGKEISTLGAVVDEFKNLIPQENKITDDEVVGTVIYVDSYGKLLMQYSLEY